jgi:hypothetical protein
MGNSFDTGNEALLELSAENVLKVYGTRALTEFKQLDILQQLSGEYYDDKKREGYTLKDVIESKEANDDIMFQRAHWKFTKGDKIAVHMFERDLLRNVLNHKELKDKNGEFFTVQTYIFEQQENSTGFSGNLSQLVMENRILTFRCMWEYFTELQNAWNRFFLETGLSSIISKQDDVDSFKSIDKFVKSLENNFSASFFRTHNMDMCKKITDSFSDTKARLDKNYIYLDNIEDETFDFDPNPPVGTTDSVLRGKLKKANTYNRELVQRLNGKSLVPAQESDDSDDNDNVGDPGYDSGDDSEFKTELRF